VFFGGRGLCSTIGLVTLLLSRTKWESKLTNGVFAVDLYPDEVAFWDAFVTGYMGKNYSAVSPSNIYEVVCIAADNLILERRKRNVVKEVVKV